MSNRFAAMVDRLIMFHRLESSRITIAFEDEKRMNLDSIFAFEKEFKTAWQKWLTNKSNLGNYLGFFRKEGVNLFKIWLTSVFPFDISSLNVNFPIGPVILAMSSGAALIPAFVLKQPDERYIGVLEDAIPLQTGNRDEAIKESLKSIVRIFEKYIRSYPDQWYYPDPITSPLFRRTAL